MYTPLYLEMRFRRLTSGRVTQRAVGTHYHCGGGRAPQVWSPCEAATCANVARASSGGRPPTRHHIVPPPDQLIVFVA